MQSPKERKDIFFALAYRLSESDNPSERQRVKEELARITVGE